LGDKPSVGQKSNIDQKDAQATPVFSNQGPDALLLPASKVERNRTKLWFFKALALSLILHGTLLFFWSPKLEKLESLRAKKPLEVEVKFKAVVNTNQLKNTKPKTADYLAETDQSADRPQKTQKNFNNEPPRPPKAPRPIKAPAKSASKSSQTDKFLAQPQASDPLGLHKRPPNSIGEYVPEVEAGKHTHLNTWSWRHAPFFNRIKMQIGHVWAPNRQIARFDPQGSLLGQKDRVTVLSVTIDAHGRLETLQVAHSSGVAYLDEEAERAFKKAAPFPYPPRDLFNTQDGFTFQFAFHLQQNKGLKFDFDWHKGD